VIVLVQTENEYFANEKRMCHYGLKKALLMWAIWGFQQLTYDIK